MGPHCVTLSLDLLSRGSLMALKHN